MPDYDPATYGDRMAGVYDEWFGIPGDAEDAVSFLAKLAGSGPALELGIGTGRVALPLAERGIEVHGIDASEAMVEKLQAKPGGAGVSASIGDFADSGVEVDRAFLETSRYDLVHQRIYSQNISMGENEIKFYPVQTRYAWPSEIDLIARLAGLRLRGRWEGWHREPFTASSGLHVSVHESG